MVNPLILELFFIFLLLPSILFFLKSTLITFFTLYIVSLYSVLILKNKSYVKKVFSEKKLDFKFIFYFSLTFIISGLGYIFLLDESLLFRFPLENFKFWFVLMVAYPLLSVLPQELVYRVFFFFRYKSLFKNNEKFLLIINTLLFSFGHIVFHNIHSIFITAIVSPIFAFAYLKRSFLTCLILHSIGGQIIFTLGLGKFFY